MMIIYNLLDTFTVHRVLSAVNESFNLLLTTHVKTILYLNNFYEAEQRIIASELNRSSIKRK